MAIAIAVLLVGTWTTMCILKGKAGMAVMGVLLFGVVGIVGACRLAKPTSWWARNQYGHDKLKKSWERFEPSPYPGVGDPRLAR